MERKHNYSIFALLKQNVAELRQLRPDLYLSPGENGCQILGSVIETEDFANAVNSNFDTVRSINTSIVLNATGFFEGLLENILLRKIGAISQLPDPLAVIASDYKGAVIRLSSLEGFKKHFRKLFRVKFSEVLNAYNEDLRFIEKFYLIRHLLSHGSMIDTSLVDKGNGIALKHDDPEYLGLMKILRVRYSYNEKVEVDFLSLLLCSEIIDDFSTTVFKLSENLVSELAKINALDSSVSWGDYSSWGLWGKI